MLTAKQSILSSVMHYCYHIGWASYISIQTLQTCFKLIHNGLDVLLNLSTCISQMLKGDIQISCSCDLLSCILSPYLIVYTIHKSIKSWIHAPMQRNKDKDVTESCAQALTAILYSKSSETSCWASTQASLHKFLILTFLQSTNRMLFCVFPDSFLIRTCLGILPSNPIHKECLFFILVVSRTICLISLHRSLSFFGS